MVDQDEDGPVDRRTWVGTERDVEALEARGRPYLVAVEGERGLRVRVSADGKTKSYQVNLRTGAKIRTVTIGKSPALRLADAKAAARRLLAAKYLGRLEGAAPLTVGEAVDRWIRSRRLAPYTRDLYSYSRARLGSILDRQVSKLTRDEVVSAVMLEDSPVASNRSLKLLRAGLRLAVDDGLLARDPSSKIRPFDETSRTRTLSLDEVDVFIEEAMAEPDRAVGEAALALLALGLRGGEALALRREWIRATQVEEGGRRRARVLLTLPATATKTREERVLAIPPALARRWEKLPRRGPLVFPFEDRQRSRWFYPIRDRAVASTCAL